MVLWCGAELRILQFECKEVSTKPISASLMKNLSENIYISSYISSQLTCASQLYTHLHNRF